MEIASMTMYHPSSKPVRCLMRLLCSDIYDRSSLNLRGDCCSCRSVRQRGLLFCPWAWRLRVERGDSCFCSPPGNSVCTKVQVTMCWDFLGKKALSRMICHLWSRWPCYGGGVSRETLFHIDRFEEKKAGVLFLFCNSLALLLELVVLVEGQGLSPREVLARGFRCLRIVSLRCLLPKPCSVVQRWQVALFCWLVLSISGAADW